MPAIAAPDIGRASRRWAAELRRERQADRRALFETAAPVDTPRLMAEPVTWLAQQRSAALVHPLLLFFLRALGELLDILSRGGKAGW